LQQGKTQNKMEIGFIIASILLVLFALLAMFDGFYLHLIKYKLYNHQESRFEHLTHTIRAILFPFILYFLYLEQSVSSFYIGVGFVILDIFTLGVDAFVEKDSRAFMGGLPRWEYIIHLFVNGLHFASIAVFLILKIDLETGSFIVRQNFNSVSAFPFFVWLVENLIPGGIIMGILHLAVMNKSMMGYCERIFKRKVQV
jgi:hypothetical protein